MGLGLGLGLGLGKWATAVDKVPKHCEFDHAPTSNQTPDSSYDHPVGPSESCLGSIKHDLRIKPHLKRTPKSKQDKINGSGLSDDVYYVALHAETLIFCSTEPISSFSEFSSISQVSLLSHISELFYWLHLKGQISKTQNELIFGTHIREN